MPFNFINVEQILLYITPTTPYVWVTNETQDVHTILIR